MVDMRRVSCFALLLTLAGCRTTPVDQAREQFYSKDWDSAAQGLEKIEPKEKDQLVYLMEKGMAYHTAGKYRDSNRSFLQALAFLEQEPISASRSVTSVVTTDRTKIYKGEQFELVLLNTYLSMNFMLLGDFEDALVECRRAVVRLKEAKEPIEQHAFTRYLTAVCYETLGEYEDAYIEYQKVQEFLSAFQAVKLDLLRLAAKLQRPEDITKWTALPGPVIGEKDEAGEVLVIIQLGKGPYKVSKETFIPPSHRVAMPVFVSRPHGITGVGVQVSSEEFSAPKMLDIDAVASNDLDKRIKKVGFKELVRKGAQEVISQSVDNIAVEILLRAAFFAMAKTDTRSWQTLPAEIRLARFRIQPGIHDVTIRLLDYSGANVAEHTFEKINVGTGRPVILNFRHF